MKKELLKQINFYYTMDNMQGNKNKLLKIVNNESIKLSHFYYSFNKDKETLQHLLKKYPQLY